MARPKGTTKDRKDLGTTVSGTNRAWLDKRHREGHKICDMVDKALDMLRKVWK